MIRHTGNIFAHRLHGRLGKLQSGLIGTLFNTAIAPAAKQADPRGMTIPQSGISEIIICACPPLWRSMDFSSEQGLNQVVPSLDVVYIFCRK